MLTRHIVRRITRSRSRGFTRARVPFGCDAGPTWPRAPAGTEKQGAEVTAQPGRWRHTPAPGLTMRTPVTVVVGLASVVLAAPLGVWLSGRAPPPLSEEDTPLLPLVSDGVGRP